METYEEKYKKAVAEVQGEQKLVVIPKFRVGDVIQLKAERLAPNEDTKIENTRKKITGITDRYYTFSDRRSILYFEQQDSFELVEQKPAEWSEDYERYISYILTNCMHYAEETGYVEEKNNSIIHQQAKDWLKSLRPQNHWKPSDAQMIVLNDIIINGHLSNANERILEGLQEQLKKLK